MKVDTSFNNFARGKIDHDMMGRYDLPIYQSGSDIIENFETNFKGNAIFRTGFTEMLGEPFQDCYMIEFKFNNQQQYICLFYNTKVRFLSYDSNGDFGWVLASTGPDVILEVTTPYSLAESKELDFSQNNDVMILAHPSYAPRELKRVSASSFTLGTFSRTNDPFGSTNNYPSCVLFYKGRLYYAATNSKITTIWGSVSGSYYDHTSSPVTATSALQFTIAEIAQKIDWLFPGDNSLIAGASDGIVAINGGGVGEGITAENIEATLTSAPPCNGAKPLAKDGLIFYVGTDGRNLYYFNYDLLTETFQADDANFVSYDITVGKMNKIRYKKDRNDLIYSTVAQGDRNMLTCNFNRKEQIVGWHEHITEGEFRDISIITNNEGRPQLFALILRDGEYYIERQAEKIEFKSRGKFFTGKTNNDKRTDNIAYNRFIAEQLKNCVYLDNSIIYNDLRTSEITYDENAGTITANANSFVSGDVDKQIVYKTATGYESGRFIITEYVSATVVNVDVLQEPTENIYSSWYLTFSSISGLSSEWNGKTVSVVSDGGYLDDFEVSSGEIEFGKQVSHVVIGFRYKGVIKSFGLGFQVQGVNTQRTMKTISEANVRCVSTAGLEVGASLYKLEPVQQLTQDDINYLPPLPIDGTKRVSYSDDNQQDKFMYLVQDLPLPAVVTTMMLTANYAVTP